MKITGSFFRKSKVAFYSAARVSGCLFAMGWLGTGLQAQVLTTLYSFNGPISGAQPQSPLFLSGDTLYGATMHGGANGYGTVFKMDVSGTGFATLYDFTDSDVDGNAANPYGPLVVYNGDLYGTASGLPSGTVFKIKTDGSGQSILHIFSGGLDGDMPFGGVTLSSNTLYGTTSSGTVFKVNTDGLGFAVLADDVVGYQSETFGGLVLEGNYLYGVTFGGGTTNYGTIFRAATSGGFRTLHTFALSDGRGPWSGLLLYSNRLYGTTTSGGSAGGGVAFAINTDGTGFTNLHHFTGYDGGSPQSTLICSGNTLYGTTMQGGGVGMAGTVFALNTDGTGFRTLYTFTGQADGGAPATALTLSGTNLFGTTTTGGNTGNGTVFRLSLPGPIPTAIVRSASSMLISWPTNATGLTLQSSTDLISWATVSAGATMNGQYMITNQISGTHQFFRLAR